MATLWECRLRNETCVVATRDILAEWLLGIDAKIELGAADIGIST